MPLVAGSAQEAGSCWAFGCRTTRLFGGATFDASYPDPIDTLYPGRQTRSFFWLGVKKNASLSRVNKTSACFFFLSFDLGRTRV